MDVRTGINVSSMRRLKRGSTLARVLTVTVLAGFLSAALPDTQAAPLTHARMAAMVVAHHGRRDDGASRMSPERMAALP